MENVLAFKPRSRLTTDEHMQAFEEECAMFRRLRDQSARLAQQLQLPGIPAEQREAMSERLAGINKVIQKQKELFFQHGMPLL